MMCRSVVASIVALAATAWSMRQPGASRLQAEDVWIQDVTLISPERRLRFCTRTSSFVPAG